MGSIIVKPGNLVPLSIQLACFETGLFPQAFLFDDTGSALNGGIPIDLTHVSAGLYVDKSFTMPTGKNVIAQYKVFKDSGHTTLSDDEAGADIFIDSSFLDPSTAPRMAGDIKATVRTKGLAVVRASSSNAKVKAQKTGGKAITGQSHITAAAKSGDLRVKVCKEC